MHVPLILHTSLIILFCYGKKSITSYPLHMKLPPLPLTVLDTETTGFVPKVHHVIEFASMRAKGGEVVDTFEQLFSVKEEIPPHIQVLTRIFPQDIANAPTFEEKLSEVRDHIGENTLLVGQNLGFDIGMIRGEGIDLSARPWIDTSMLASLVFPEFRSYSLAYMSSMLKLNHAPAHRALGDVRATLELLSKVWERLLELSPSELAFAKEIMSRTSSGYALLFDAIPESQSAGASWITKKARADREISDQRLEIRKPEVGTVQLYEEGLDPNGLQEIMNGAAANEGKTWIAVKNLEAQLRRLHLPSSVTVFHPAHLLLNPDAATALRAQQTMTTDEALITLKLEWFHPRTRNDVALHGVEKDIWNGKLSCTETSSVYTDQFQKAAHVSLLDHRQLLAFLADPQHAAQKALTPDAHIIIDDASMLEDTATKAYGHECSVDALRAAANGDEALTSLTDLLSIWIEKLRKGEEVHYMTLDDMQSDETKGLQAQVGDILASGELPEKTREQLLELAALLEPMLLRDNVVWAECRMNGSLFLHSAPESVDEVLDVYLYDRFATTLLVPAGCTETLVEVVPRNRAILSTIDDDREVCDITVSFPDDVSTGTFLKDPLPGKTIILAGSKRVIEQLYVQHTQILEEKDITMICQGLSGGQGRMEAEFLAATGTTIMIMTPWMYEGTELPLGSVDRLLLEALPFDHPNQPIFGKRKDHHQNGFELYAMPRVECRLFRLLRTFCRERKEGGDMMILDKRLQEKAYGKRIREYMRQFGMETVEPTYPPKAEPDQLKLF
jgi:DNA polymerase III epsilon subunit-like protein